MRNQSRVTDVVTEAAAVRQDCDRHRPGPLVSPTAVRLVPKNRNVRILPCQARCRSHRSTAGCHDGIPQNSPILVHNSSADSVEVAVKRKLKRQR